jgi:hypothetical protein
MALPPLYKYLDVQGAKLTLGNRTFKHAKPSDFNDTEDLTIQSISQKTSRWHSRSFRAPSRISCSRTGISLRHASTSK